MPMQGFIVLITAFHDTNTIQKDRLIDEDNFRWLMNVVYLANNTNSFDMD